MRNKLLIIVGVIVVLFVGLVVINNVKNDEKTVSGDNPYGDKKLKQETIDQLDDPLYQNIILHTELERAIKNKDQLDYTIYQNIILTKELERALKNKEDMTVYFFSPTCIHCINATPVVVPLVEELDIDMKKLNTLEYEEALSEFNIQGTPTIIHYENGEEVTRFEGAAEEEQYREFFEENVLEQ